MTLQERIDQLDDFTLMNFYNHFTASLIEKLNADLPTIVGSIPESIRTLPEVDGMLQADMGEVVETTEAITFARQSLSFWANDPQLAPVLDEMLTNYRDNTAGAGVLLELSGAVSMILILATSSIKRDKYGRWEINLLGLSAKEVMARVEAIKELLKGLS